MYVYYDNVAVPSIPLHLNVYETLKATPGFVHHVINDDQYVLTLEVPGYLLLWVQLHKLYEAGISYAPVAGLKIVPPRVFTWGTYIVWVGDFPTDDELDPQDTNG